MPYISPSYCSLFVRDRDRSSRCADYETAGLPYFQPSGVGRARWCADARGIGVAGVTRRLEKKFVAKPRRIHRPRLTIGVTAWTCYCRVDTPCEIRHASRSGSSLKAHLATRRRQGPRALAARPISIRRLDAQPLATMLAARRARALLGGPRRPRAVPLGPDRSRPSPSPGDPRRRPPPATIDACARHARPRSPKTCDEDALTPRTASRAAERWRSPIALADLGGVWLAGGHRPRR